MSRFYFGGSDSESGGEEDNLPYPQPLASSHFLTPNFSPAEFLSSLSNRHQTLEDLRSELRARSQELNKELLDLVNENYQDFLGLGSSLTGGDEKVEEVRVGLLSFRRDVEGLKGKVATRREEVSRLLEEKKVVTARIRTARAFLELESRIEELERALSVANDAAVPNAKDDEDAISISASEESEEDDVGMTFSVAKIWRRVHQFVGIKRLVNKLGHDHPFLTKQASRIEKIHETLLLDLRGALRESRQSESAKAGSLKILQLYSVLDESAAAVKAARET